MSLGPKKYLIKYFYNCDFLGERVIEGIWNCIDDPKLTKRAFEMAHKFNMGQANNIKIHRVLK